MRSLGAFGVMLAGADCARACTSNFGLRIGWAEPYCGMSCPGAGQLPWSYLLGTQGGGPGGGGGTPVVLACSPWSGDGVDVYLPLLLASVGTVGGVSLSLCPSPSLLYVPVVFLEVLDCVVTGDCDGRVCWVWVGAQAIVEEVPFCGVPLPGGLGL